MTTTQQTTWPEGIIARYFTLADATVTVWDADKWSPVQAICSGCGKSSRDGGPDSSLPHRWAEKHAATCRALPRPTA